MKIFAKLFRRSPAVQTNAVLPMPNPGGTLTVAQRFCIIVEKSGATICEAERALEVLKKEHRRFIETGAVYQAACARLDIETFRAKLKELKRERKRLLRDAAQALKCLPANISSTSEGAHGHV